MDIKSFILANKEAIEKLAIKNGIMKIVGIIFMKN